MMPSHALTAGVERSGEGLRIVAPSLMLVIVQVPICLRERTPDYYINSFRRELEADVAIDIVLCPTPNGLCAFEVSNARDHAVRISAVVISATRPVGVFK